LAAARLYVSGMASLHTAWGTLPAELETARRSLTVYLCSARRVRDDNEDGTEAWRYRSRPSGLDLHAHVTRDGPLAVVTHLRVRRY
jgi:hypothetical protein